MSQFTRRQFVGSSLAATASVALAPSLTRAVAPNDKMGVVVVGAGGRGGRGRHARLTGTCGASGRLPDAMIPKFARDPTLPIIVSYRE